MSIGLAAGIGAAGGLIQGAINAKQSRRNMKRQFNYNMQMADYNYAKNLEMWNRQNEYNSPAAQMKRYKDAGLNPHLIYGQGSSGNAQTMPTYQASAPDTSGITSPVQLTGALGQYQAMGQNRAQTDLLSEQFATQREETVLRHKKQIAQGMDNFIKQKTEYGFWKRSEVFPFTEQLDPSLKSGKVRTVKHSKTGMYDFMYATNLRLAETYMPKALKGLDAQDIAYRQQQLRNNYITLENEYKAYVNALAADGISPQDAIDIRQMWKAYGAEGVQNLALFNYTIDTAGKIIDFKNPGKYRKQQGTPPSSIDKKIMNRYEAYQTLYGKGPNR